MCFISRRRFLALASAALLVACGQPADSPAQPAAGRPTFILFYAQG
ncbi:MAG: hypothetical protein NZM18_11380 [Thermoflexales bacterium]|nr:hypothetical protein [Thermoflexales bacterium]MDW8351061.1 hypothetical protein [Anaerolineae bacterium]